MQSDTRLTGQNAKSCGKCLRRLKKRAARMGPKMRELMSGGISTVLAMCNSAEAGFPQPRAH